MIPVTVLVTGANGYLGQGVVSCLLDDGVNVVAAGRKTNRVDSRARRVDVDIFSIENPYEFFGAPDILLHLAWRDGFIHDAQSHIDDLPKHVRFIKKLLQSGIQQVCVMGSMHEVGFFEGCVDENTPAEPQSLYGISKNALRQITALMAKQYGVVYQWLRGFYIVGNPEEGQSVFSKLTAAERRGDTEFPFTTGTNQYDFIDYDAFCLQVASVVEQSCITGVINCCSGVPVALGDRMERFIRDNGYRIRLKYGAFPDREYDSKAIWGDVSKIQDILALRNT